jgi:hypothetical protein
MNDQELDDMLNQWDTPAVPPTMRENVRAGFRERVVRAIPIIPRPRFPRLRFAFGFAGLATALLLATAAFPQVALMLSSEPIPYSVDSEFVIFPFDREPRAYMTATSYSRNGKEVVLTWSMSDHPFAGPIHRAIGALITLIHGSPEEASDATATLGCGHACFGMASESLGPAAQLLSNGCVTGTVVGRETILGHATVAVQRPLEGGGRGTFWLAPDLGCHSLRTSIEWQAPDGHYQRTREKRALRINSGSSQ